MTGREHPLMSTARLTFPSVLLMMMVHIRTGNSLELTVVISFRRHCNWRTQNTPTSQQRDFRLHCLIVTFTAQPTWCRFFFFYIMDLLLINDSKYFYTLFFFKLFFFVKWLFTVPVRTIYLYFIFLSADQKPLT